MSRETVELLMLKGIISDATPQEQADIRLRVAEITDLVLAKPAATMLAISLVALQALWSFASLVAEGEAFSPRAVVLGRRIRNCFAVTAAYLLVAFTAVTIAMQPGQSPGVFLAFVVGEIISLFLFTFAAIMVGLFENAASLREENAMTV